MTGSEAFRASLADDAPPPGLDLAAQALWWAGKGRWDQAHEVAQSAEGTASVDWVHAYLHRVEGDLDNAGYWYRRAGRPAATGALPAEWDAIVSALVGPSTRSIATE